MPLLPYWEGLIECLGGLNQGVWQHTYVQNAACNHFGSGQAGGVLVTGARHSDTGFLATLLQGLGILASDFGWILVNMLAETWKSTHLQVPFAPHQIYISYQLLLGQGLDVSDAQQKERGKDGAVSWAHAFHGTCEKEDLSDHREKLFSKAYLLTRHPLDQTLGSRRSPGTAHTLSYRQKVQLFDMYSGWMVIHDSLFDRDTGKRSQDCKDEVIPCSQWCDINMRVEERVHSRRKGFTFRRPLAEMTDVAKRMLFRFFFDLEYWTTPVLAILVHSYDCRLYLESYIRKHSGSVDIIMKYTLHGSRYFVIDFTWLYALLFPTPF